MASSRATMQRPEIAQVVGDHRAVLGPRQGQHIGIGQRFLLRVPSDGFHVVPAYAQGPGWQVHPPGPGTQAADRGVVQADTQRLTHVAHCSSQ